MFQPAPRRHRRLPSGTMVSYAEVKSYLSKREIPQLFESLMAGLMYHRPENHIGYLQSCLEEVKSNSDTKVQWSTFVNAKKRKSKEILPPLTPKKQDSFSSSWSDNSRQSTPLPPISARTRMRTSMEQQDYRNTYILYHNPPPILAKPKVPVVSVLGGLGSKIDELCERVVGRLRGVVHISTCSMLKTRMTIEGFYRVTSVPACAVVDSVLQAMSMVQSATALLVAGFPRNRGDIEEYRSRRVRMDGVVLVDFEEEALRSFLEHEVASGIVRTSEIEAELERFKQDIISVAEYYDEKDLLTVVMGDQDIEEIIDDLILAVDKVIETRKNINEEDATDGKKARECESPCNALMPSPDRLERPSTVEIRDATEEDIKSIEEESKKLSAKEDTAEEVVETLIKDGEELGAENTTTAPEDNMDQDGAEAEKLQSKSEDEELDGKEEEVDEDGKETIEMEVETENKENETDNEMEKSKSGEEELAVDAKEETEDESKKDEPVLSESNGQQSQNSQIHIEQEQNEKDEDSENNDAEKAEKSEGGSSEKHENPEDDKEAEEENAEALETEKPDIPLVFALENITVDYDEIKNLIANDLEMCFIDFYEFMRNDGSEDDKFDNEEALKMLSGILKQDSVSYSNGFFIFKFPISLLNATFIENTLKLGNVNFVCKVRENEDDSETKMFEEKLFNTSMSEKVRIIFVTENNAVDELRTTLQEIIKNKNSVREKLLEDSGDKIDENAEKSNEAECENEEEVNELNEEVEDIGEENVKEAEEEVMLKSQQNNDEHNEVVQENEIMTDDKTEDSTGKDIEDLVSDDTLNEGSKLPESLKTDENQDINPDDAEVDNTHSQASTIASVGDETQRERAVLERQCGLEIETDDASLHPPSEKSKASLIRQNTYSANEEEKNEEKEDVEINESSTKEEMPNESASTPAAVENNNNEDENNDIKENSNKSPTEEEDNATEIKPENSETQETHINEEENLVDEKDNSEKEQIENEENKETKTTENEENKETETTENEENKETETTENEHNKETETTENEEKEGEDQEKEGVNTENKEKEGEEQGKEEVKVENEEEEDEDQGKLEVNVETEEKEKETGDNEEKEHIKENEDDGGTETAKNEETETGEDAENKETEAENVEQTTEAENMEDETGEANKSQDNAGDEEKSAQEDASVKNGKNDSENEKNSEKHDGESNVSENQNDNENSVKVELDDAKENTENSTTEEKAEDPLTAENNAEENASERISEKEENEDANNINAEELEKQPDEKSEISEQSENVDPQNDAEKSASGENVKSEGDELPEDTADEHKTSEESTKCESVSLENKDKDAEDETDISEQKSEGKSSDKENSTSLKSSTADKPKVLDNDSDSNDENITIETKAEIHAVDCASPSTAEAEKTDSKSIHETENEEIEVKSDIQNAENEEINLNIDGNSSNNKQNEADNEALNKENSSKNDDEKETDALSIKDIESLGSERFSGKRQERNGSGILDESRQEDGRESEEPQERSSSSSRGEL